MWVRVGGIKEVPGEYLRRSVHDVEISQLADDQDSWCYFGRSEMLKSDIILALCVYVCVCVWVCMCVY